MERLFLQKDEVASNYPVSSWQTVLFAEFGAHPFDECLRVKRAGPRNNCLNGALKIASGRGANTADVAGLERAEDFVEDAECLLSSPPFRFGAE